MAARTPLAVLAVGFGFSLAANLLWTWPGGPVRILGGALASIALPAAIHMWPQVRADRWIGRAIRNLAMTGIAGLAAATTFTHASSLLIAHGEIQWLAYAYPVVTELLVVLAVLTRQPTTKRSARTQPRTIPVKTTAPAKPSAESTPPPPSEIGERSQQRVAMVMWAQMQDQLPPIKAIQNKFRVSQSTAKRVRNDARNLVAS